MRVSDTLCLRRSAKNMMKAKKEKEKEVRGLRYFGANVIIMVDY